MSIRGRWRPPKPLPALLLACSFSSSAVLTWAGWTLIRQERAEEEHELEQQAAAMADRLRVSLRGSLATAEARLGEWITRPPGQSIAPAELFLILEGGRCVAHPARKLLYHATTEPGPEPGVQMWVEPEAQEFQQGKPGALLERSGAAVR